MTKPERTADGIASKYFWRLRNDGFLSLERLPEGESMARLSAPTIIISPKGDLA